METKIKCDNEYGVVLISTYAKAVGKTPTRIYQMAKEGKIDIVKLDQTQFVKLKDHEIERS